MDRDKIPKDPKSRRIYQLERLIRKFKQYDADRTEYLHKIQNELEDYSERYTSLKKAVSVDDRYLKLEEKIKNLKANLGAVNKKYGELKKEVEMLQNPELMEKACYVIEHYSVVKLKEKCDDLDKEVDRLKKANSELVARIVQLNKQIENENENQSKV